ncbi:MAG TPA: polyphenol oxidase family protein [Nitriliruptorales bacterium]|nr:polyphenol oxidase family protein [Nitriliruptorales bacterium]
MTAPAHLVAPVRLAQGVGAWFTGRAADNLAHRRPHQPRHLARARRAVAAAAGLRSHDLHFMQQVHGAEVGVVTDDTAVGAELRGVDVLVTATPGRALVVQVADCVPVLLAASDGPVAVVHAGRRGLRAGVVQAALDGVAALGAPPSSVRAAIGPSIGGCCYEVPPQLRDTFAAEHPAAAATTTWGTPSLDLPAAVSSILESAGARVVSGPPGCTRCDPDLRWFSHRADPSAGRQAGIVVRRRGRD